MKSETGHGSKTACLAKGATLVCSLLLQLRRKMVRRGECSEVPCMDGACGAREKSGISAKRSGAAMYSAFECGRFGRWP